MNNIPITITYQGMLLKGHANPLETLDDSTPSSLMIYIQGWCLGILNYRNKEWAMDKPIDPKFIESLGQYIYLYLQALKKTCAINENCVYII
jgi:hypothetical protein